MKTTSAQNVMKRVRAMNRLKQLIPRDSTEFAFAVIIVVGLCFLVMTLVLDPLEVCDCGLRN